MVPYSGEKKDLQEITVVRGVPRRTAFHAFSVLVFCFCISLVLQVASHVYDAPFTGYPDEAAHYVTGLLVHDYLRHPFQNPVRFAEDYYLHYPKVSIGHWPPGFYLLQALWTTIFPVSVASILVLMALLAAVLAMLLYRTVRAEFGEAYGISAALVLVCLQVTQQQAAEVMTELPLAILAFLSLLAFRRYLETGLARDSLVFGFCILATILTKGDGWSLGLMVAIAIILCRRLDCLKQPAFWVAALPPLLIGAPYTLWSLPLAKAGWEGQAWSFTFLRQALPLSGMCLWEALGPGLLAVGLCCIWVRILARWRTRYVEPLWAVMTGGILATVIFQNLVPAGVEWRKFYMLVAPFLVLAMGGIAWIAENTSLRQLPSAVCAPLLLLIAIATSGGALVRVNPRPPFPMMAVARHLAVRPDLQKSVFLVWSDGIGEGAFVAEIAAKDHRPGRYVLRGGKQIVLRSFNGGTIRRIVDSRQGVDRLLDTIPVTVVVVDPPRLKPEETDLLIGTLAERVDKWQRIPFPANGKEGPILVYRRISPLSTEHPKIRIDMEPSLHKVLRTDD